MAINATNLIWGPNNQFAFDPASRQYFMAPSGAAGWGVNPSVNGVGKVGSTMYSSQNAENNAFGQSLAANGGKYVLGSAPNIYTNYGGGDFSNTSGLTPEQQQLLAGGAQGWNGQYGAPSATEVTQAPEESFLSSLMQASMPITAGLGISGLMGGGLGGLGNLFGGSNGGGMSLWDSISNIFGGGGSNVIPATEWPATNFWSGGAGSGAGNILWDQGLGAASGDMIPATQWPSNMWTGQVGGGTPMVSWDGAAPVPFSSGGLGVGDAIKAASQAAGGSGNGSLLGGLLGALAGGLGANSKPAGTTTSIQDIPDYLKPYQSMNLTSGVNNFANASAGQALLPGAQQYLSNQIAGKYLDPNQNPAFQPYVKDLMGQAGANYAGLYGKNPDNLNNSGFQEGYTRAITNAVLPLYNSAFQTAQGNQYNAASNAPAYANNVAGAALAPNLAFKNLYTGPTANTQPYFTSPLGGALSGGLAGYTFGNSIFGSKN